LSHRLTNIPGSSAYFYRGYVVYSNQAKIDTVGVPSSLIAEYGAVSEEVARALAEGVREKIPYRYRDWNHRHCWSFRRFEAKTRRISLYWNIQFSTYSG
jgi:hypothetical protein